MSHFLCAKYKISPRKKMGQHFLIDKTVLEKIISAAELKPNDVVLEIGPGLGILTKALAEKVKKVIAVEADKKIAAILKQEVGDSQSVVPTNVGIPLPAQKPSIQIVEADILKISAQALTSLLDGAFITKGLPRPLINQGARNDTKDFKIIANLPYQITSPVLWKFLQQGPRPSMMVVMVQKEVAERICAKPGEMNLLAVLVQFYGTPKLVVKVSRQSFWPPPKVESAILKIVDINDRRYNIKNQDQFFAMVKAGFHCPRKQLQNNLADYLQTNKKTVQETLQKLDLNPRSRAESLSIQDWVALYKRLGLAIN